MFDYYFTFRSLTAAQQAAAELQSHMIFPSLLRAPKSLSSMGCAYAARVMFPDGKFAAATLRKSGVVFEKVFVQDNLGVWREVHL